MLHGLVHDSAVLGTIKHAQHALKSNKHHSVKRSSGSDLKDLVDGLSEASELIIEGLTRLAELVERLKR